ncbi:MAG TPA: 3-hydroxyacyl-CoA dehydrogenase NAD-binding domain-containing protein [Flexivirga sp.]|uniref:3-hydroxyacyl-CoA dehydrogenase NAD-binding domain-containing protein n=1 Tax=Flexivirga sp. TaxID=1962927 RepID=UPI002C3C70CD|nr:3-hydroxyacyl-CoA dehydrogenase NAD-binding domain-containing protein [Flexivirga sp.]HWC22747.1 3-hydroxyacyl-CoA dehydrogenase NAD-binding domain-containing protein [Flexivirga sp.]
MQHEPVSVAIDDGVAILRIVNPPVNVSTSAVRRGLIAGLGIAQQRPDVQAVVIIGAPGGNFVSGSDLAEFDGPVADPALPAVIERIEQCPKPVLAALSGMTLGGGFELALGCDGRIGTPDTVVGLPEIGLGIIPGAGGTQRPQRILGAARTLELITSNERLTAPEALSLGLIDDIVSSDLLEHAVRAASALMAKRVLLEAPIPPDRPGVLEQTAGTVLAQNGPRPQYVAAVGSVLAAASLSPTAALRHERAEFERLRESAEAGALRHLFFARRSVAKANHPASPVSVRRVAVVGAGTMGAGIARAFAEAGIEVRLFDQDRSAADAGVERLSAGWQAEADRGRIDRDSARRQSESVTCAQSLDALRGSDLAVEAVVEDLDIKRRVLADLEDVVGRGVPLATNTSYLDIDVLADSLRHPGSLVGLHFFAPAHRTRVLEIVRGQATSSRAMDAAFAAARALRKTPIVARVCEGFIGNRIYNAYRRQCELMIEEGALPHEIDDAAVGFGFAMGPFAVADMSGLDIAWRMRQRTADARDPHVRYPDVADVLCEKGRFGQKTGSGWYRYEPGSRVPLRDAAVEQLIRQSSRRKGIERQQFSSRQIVDRLLVTMANEAALILDEGIAQRAGDIDLMLTLGYGFPEHIGGITHWAACCDPTWLTKARDSVAAVTGPGYPMGDLSLLTKY